MGEAAQVLNLVTIHNNKYNAERRGIRMKRKFKGVMTSFRKYKEYRNFKQEFKRLKEQGADRFRLEWDDIMPLLRDKNRIGFDAHYFYHLSWAARKLREIAPVKHVDISSHYFWAGIVSSFIPTDYYELNTIKVEGLDGYSNGFADLYELPFRSQSISSLSCMHVVEHVGLGRYGDTLDYDGDMKAIAELKRITASGGDILFVVPVGNEPVIVFNAHRVYSYEQVRSYFQECDLQEFALISENSMGDGIIHNPDLDLLNGEEYACGCFHFLKK